MKRQIIMMLLSMILIPPIPMEASRSTGGHCCHQSFIHRHSTARTIRWKKSKKPNFKSAKKTHKKGFWYW